jgi:hypothetical protein
MQLPTSLQVNAGLGHVYASLGAATAVTVFFGLNPDLANTIAPAVHQIGDGISKIIAGVTALIPVGTAIYTMVKNSPYARLLQAKANPEIAQLQAVPGTATAALAEQIPGNKITVAAS